MHIGRRRFRTAAAAIVWVGVAGTLVTAAGTAVAAHYVAGMGWQLALLRRHGGGRDRPGGGVLRVRPPGDRRAHRGPARGRVGRQRPGRDRAARGAARGARQRRRGRLARGRRVRPADGGRHGHGSGRRPRAARRSCAACRCRARACTPRGCWPACWSSSALATVAQRVGVPRGLRGRDPHRRRARAVQAGDRSASTPRSPAWRRSSRSSCSGLTMRLSELGSAGRLGRRAWRSRPCSPS